MRTPHLKRWPFIYPKQETWRSGMTSLHTARRTSPHTPVPPCNGKTQMKTVRTLVSLYGGHVGGAGLTWPWQNCTRTVRVTIRSGHDQTPPRSIVRVFGPWKTKAGNTITESIRCRLTYEYYEFAVYPLKKRYTKTSATAIVGHHHGDDLLVAHPVGASHKKGQGGGRRPKEIQCSQKRT
jgi:hypothetical protein